MCDGFLRPLQPLGPGGSDQGGDSAEVRPLLRFGSIVSHTLFACVYRAFGSAESCSISSSLFTGQKKYLGN